MEMAIKCPKCKSDNPGTATFCADCGTQLPSFEDIEVTETIETPKKELTRGTTFADRYEIIEELGKGGMGKVYRVEDKKLKQEVALKLIKPEIASDEKTIERFRNELKTARMIAHKNVCRMFDIGESDDSHFITMEFIRGEDLKNLIRKMGQLSAGQAISIAKQICDGLIEAHKLGVIHRDLKPQNIMIDREGDARIMDFGIARSLEGKGITGAGVMIGTPDYMSPEQVDGKETDQRSDIYSLGVILYEMVTGRVPFEGDTALSIAVKHKIESPKDPREFNTQLSEDLSLIILQCLEKDKAGRYQNARDLKVKLEQIEEGIPTVEKIVPERKPLTSREITVRFDLKKILIPALVILLVVSSALVFFLTRGPQLESNRVVVTAFLNQTGDPSLDPLGRRAAEMVSQGLKTIVGLDVAPVASFDLGQQSSVQEKHFHRISKSTKSAIVIAGEYYQQGENLTFHSNIYDMSKMRLSPSPEPISGQRQDPSEALDVLRKRLMSAVLGIYDPRMDFWLISSTYTPEYEALIEFIKGMELFLRREGKESIEYFDRAAEIDSNYMLPLLMAAIAHANAGYFSVAAQKLEKINEIPNLSQGERNLQNWLDAWLKGDNESMFRISQQLETQVPGTSQSYEVALEANYTNRPKIAIEALSRLDPEGVHMKDWIGYWGVLTTAHHMVGDFEQEFKAGLKAQKQYPNSWWPLHYKINALAAQGNMDEVHRVLEESHAKPLTGIWNPARLMALAGIEFKSHGYGEAAAKMFEQALSWLRERSTEERQSERMKYQHAWALLNTKNLDEASTVLGELVVSYPENLSYLGSLGLALAKKGDHEEALRISDKIKNWNKPYLFGSDQFWQAAIAASLGEKDRAISFLRSAIAQGLRYSGLYCNIILEPLWDYPPFKELIKPRE
jgi:serine/threonine protein kinase/tetratricopeptide (TPR) repeat protein